MPPKKSSRKRRRSPPTVEDLENELASLSLRGRNFREDFDYARQFPLHRRPRVDDYTIDSITNDFNNLGIPNDATIDSITNDFARLNAGNRVPEDTTTRDLESRMNSWTPFRFEDESFMNYRNRPSNRKERELIDDTNAFNISLRHRRPSEGYIETKDGDVDRMIKSMDDLDFTFTPGYHRPQTQTAAARRRARALQRQRKMSRRNRNKR